MEGREVFKHAVGMITDVIEATFAQAGITADDLDWFVPHQANKRIIDASAKKLGIAEQKVVVTVDLHGNTSAASVPLALSVAVADGRIKKGDLVLLEAMGGGFTWGAVLVAGKWPNVRVRSLTLTDQLPNALPLLVSIYVFELMGRSHGGKDTYARRPCRSCLPQGWLVAN